MKRYLLAAASVAAFAASPAAARDHSAYFGIEAGPMWARDSHVHSPLIELFTEVDGVDAMTVDHKMGVDGDLIAGYDFGIVRAEVEGAYKWAKHDEYSVEGLGSADADGHSRAYSLMGNLLIDLGDNEKVNFYGGGGVGIAFLRQRFSFDDDSSDFKIKDSGLAWQGILGVRAPVFRHFDIGLKYRYFRGPKIKDHFDIGASAPNIVDVTSRFSSHSLLASLIYNFADVEAPPPPPLPPPPPPPPPPAPPTQTCPDGSVILASDACPVPPPPPPPPPPAPERGL